jgi:hypothetical protein
MGLFLSAKSINTLAWSSTTLRDRESPQRGESGSPGGSPAGGRPRGIPEAYDRWERHAMWQRNYSAWMAHAVPALR